MGLLSRLWRRRAEPTGTILGNPSALDEVLAKEPRPIFQGRVLRGVWRAREDEAVQADLGRDLSSAFDDVEAAEQRRRDAWREPDAQ